MNNQTFLNMINNVDEYINKTEIWREETKTLRAIILECGLSEEIKWGKPCYTFKGKNIVLIQGFKKYFALLFFKGYLLEDPNKILIKTGDKTEIGRQIRFNNVEEIREMESIIKSYIYEAMEVEKTIKI